MSLTRRALLQLAGLAALPAFAHADEATLEAWAESIHAQAGRPVADPFRTDERALIAAIADGILPRTDTPGALDVGAPAFVEVIVMEWMTPEDRTAFRAGLAALDTRARAAYGLPWPALDPVQRDGELAWAEQPLDANHPAKATYRRLKGLLLHGYFTSDRVRREVLKVNITPGHFHGNVPVGTPAPAGGHAHG
jgi:Gluconate 2-dehydrogenase subunit 3